jgi:hypothetical protein
MPEFLKGNYKVDAKIEDAVDAVDSTDEFEKKALSRLGGSICFVSKKSLLWQGEAQPVGGSAAGGEATGKTAGRADTDDSPAKGSQDGAGRKTSSRD